MVVSNVHIILCGMTTFQLILCFQLLFKLLLAEFIYPDTTYPNNIVNRNISQITQQDWQWIHENCGLVRNNTQVGEVCSFIMYYLSSHFHGS